MSFHHRSFRVRRAAAALALGLVPLTMTACAEEEPVEEGVVEEQSEEGADD